MLHVITQYVLEIPIVLDIPAADMWQKVNQVKFGVWLQSSSFECRKLATKCMALCAEHIADRLLRFVHERVGSHVN